ncbi:hypothetical protein [Flavobacterium polysaccharolyticum]|uniref:Outer membrane protein assembly factor BamA n=1 Tax=Flavobacterium polysaccharolyticum TaxID=3133148 RepID=A0ABU9NNP5_9FLAO
MRYLLPLILFTTTFQVCFGQKLTLKIAGKTEKETKIIDSLNYNRVHNNITSIKKEIQLTSHKLEKIGYIENNPSVVEKKNDSTFHTEIELKAQIKNIHIYIGKNQNLKQLFDQDANKDTLRIKYPEINTLLEEFIKKLEAKGYPLVKAQLVDIKRKNNILIADLSIKTNSQRKINQIVIKNNDSEKKQNYFPQNHLSQINKKFKNKILNQKTIELLKDQFNNYPFIRQIKDPEVLFSNDSTIAYVYIEKKAANSFDGYIAIGNNNQDKTRLNGYLDIQLNNLLKKGEEFYIYWKSDGNDQKTFNTGLKLDYLFRTPIGLKASLNIFKQDSTFQNSKTLVDITYPINIKTKVYTGIESTVSSDIQNSNNTIISDYKNQFITTGLLYQKNNKKNILFEEKTKLNIRIGIGSRNTSNTNNTSNQKQFFANLNLTHNFIINPKNSINIRSQNFYLNSKTYLTNELFRFGGLHSVRGYAENSFQGNYISTLLTEYRHFLNQSLYIHSILDYGIFKDESNSTILKKNNNITGIGIGIGMYTKNGFFKFSITNGTNSYNDINFFNSIVNLCYNVKF